MSQLYIYSWFCMLMGAHGMSICHGWSSYHSLHSNRQLYADSGGMNQTEEGNCYIFVLHMVTGGTTQRKDVGAEAEQSSTAGQQHTGSCRKWLAGGLILLSLYR